MTNLGTVAKPATDDDFDHFKQLADNDEGWSRQYDSHGVIVWTQATENSSIKLLRVRKST